MKKAYTAAAGLLALVLCLTAALASGGSDQDPLISLSYLEGAFSQSVDAAVDSRLDEWDRQAAASMERQLDAMGSGQVDETASEADLKEGDVLAGATGLAVTPLAGEVRLEIASGAVVDATEGVEVPGGTVLDANHLYIVAEGSSASFVVDSPTAVLSYQGGGALSLSYGAPDYYAIARALRQLGLFRGTGSGIGEGFDLHLAPTRGEGLVMFIRILGEEDQAMAWTGEHPFTDVPAWLDPYVAWAWERGYTNGVSETIFGGGEALTPQAYMEFLLRALGYSVAGIHHQPGPGPGLRRPDGGGGENARRGALPALPCGLCLLVQPGHSGQRQRTDPGPAAGRRRAVHRRRARRRPLRRHFPSPELTPPTASCI